MKVLYLTSILLCSFFFFESQKNNVERIGYIKDSQYIITLDTVQYKGFLERIITIPGIHLSKTEILKSKTVGERQEDFYMLMVSDESGKTKIAHWLVKEENNFYFFQNKTNKEIDDEVFFNTYYTCHGSETNCSPMVRYFADEGYSWGISAERICSINSNCETTSSYIIFE